MPPKPKPGQILVVRQEGERIDAIHIECDCDREGSDIKDIRAPRVYVPTCMNCGTRRGWYLRDA